MRFLAAVVLAGCFHPSIPGGAPCAEDGSCPGDLACRAGRCEDPAIDAAVDGPEDASPDALIDAMIDAAGCATFSRQFDTCTLAAGTSLTLSGTAYTYDTDSHVLRNGSAALTVTRALVTGKANPIDVLVVDSLTVTPGSILRVTGSRPFGIVARGTVSISGTIDASAGGAGTRTPLACGSATGGTRVAHAQGPGGGAAFQGAGGTGGVGDANALNDPGGIAGFPIALPLGPVGAGRGSGGSGGGGGAGGMILIESPSVTVGGILVANGGGGGGGADNIAGVDGSAGAVGTASTMRAAGGIGAPPNEGGSGGAGSAGALLAGLASPSTPDNGGGGGGGGAGYISIIGTSTTTGSLISPPLTPFP